MAAPVDTGYDRVVSYGIRRCEFDHYLLKRSQARASLETPLRSLVAMEGRGWPTTRSRPQS